MLCLLCGEECVNCMDPEEETGFMDTCEYSHSRTLCQILEIPTEEYEEVLSLATLCKDCLGQLGKAEIKLEPEGDPVEVLEEQRRSLLKERLMSSWMKLQSEDVHADNYCPWQSVRLRILLELGAVIEIVDDPFPVGALEECKANDNYTSQPFSEDSLNLIASGTEMRRESEINICFVGDDEEFSNEGPLCLVLHSRNQIEMESSTCLEVREDNYRNRLQGKPCERNVSVSHEEEIGEEKILEVPTGLIGSQDEIVKAMSRDDKPECMISSLTSEIFSSPMLSSEEEICSRSTPVIQDLTLVRQEQMTPIITSSYSISEDTSGARKSKRKPLRPTKGIYSLKSPDRREPSSSISAKSVFVRELVKPESSTSPPSVSLLPPSVNATTNNCTTTTAIEIPIYSVVTSMNEFNPGQDQTTDEFYIRVRKDCPGDAPTFDRSFEDGLTTSGNETVLRKIEDTEESVKAGVVPADPVSSLNLGYKGFSSQFSSLANKLKDRAGKNSKHSAKLKSRRRTSKFSRAQKSSGPTNGRAKNSAKNEIGTSSVEPSPVISNRLLGRRAVSPGEEDQTEVVKRSRRSRRRIYRSVLFSDDFESPPVRRRVAKRKIEQENSSGKTETYNRKNQGDFISRDSSLSDLSSDLDIKFVGDQETQQRLDGVNDHLKLSILNNNNAQPNEENPDELSSGLEDNKQKFKCSNKDCDRRFSTQDRRDNHFRRKHEGIRNLFSCHICSKTFPARTRLATHLERHEKAGKTYPCDQCDKSFPTQKKLEFHLYQHSQNWGLYCDICNKGFPSGQEQRLANHRKIHDETRPRPFECATCGRKFSSQQYLNIHQKNHPIQPDPDGLFRCSVETCQLTFRAVTSFREHQRIHTGELPFKCDVCGKRFGYITGYKKHMISHTDEKHHVCHICGKQFKQKGNLNLHIGRHNGVKPYKCTFPGCEFSFFDQYKLKNHMDVHTGKRIYKCGECEKCFRTTTGLKSHHAAVHEKERKYKCHCGKAFSQKQYLQFHRTQHPELNLKRFTCDVCSKKFSEPSSLREHKRRFHTGETSFQCDKCDYTACFKSRMDKHLLTHSNPQFDCTTCGKQFRQANNLKRHLATVHTAKNT